MPTPVVRPDNLSIPFANSGEKNTIPVPSQVGTNPQLASLTTGFPPLTMTPVGSGGKPPYGQDMNGILYWLSQHTVFQNAGGQYRFDAALATAIGGYDIGTVLQNDDGTAAYVSAIDNNTGDFNTNPALIGTDWIAYSGVPSIQYITGSGAGGLKDTVLTLPGGLIIQFFWGFAGQTTDSPVYITNAFPIAFPTECNMVMGMHFGFDPSVNIVLDTFTTTNCRAYSNVTGFTDVYCMMIAVGH